MEKSQGIFFIASESIFLFGILRGHAPAEQAVGPELVEEDDGNENARDDRHDGERVRRGRGVLDGQAVCGMNARDHEPREKPREEADRRQGNRERGESEARAVPLVCEQDIGEHEKHGGAHEREDGERPREKIRLNIRQHRAEREEADGDASDGLSERTRPLDEARLREAQCQKRCAVVEEDEKEREAADDGVEAQEVEEAARIDHLVIDGQAAEEIRDGDTPKNRWQDAAEGDASLPEMAPGGRLAPPAELERHAAQDEREEHQKQREVERREHRRVDVRERSEERAARRDHPDLVAVPDRRDRAQDHRAVAVSAREEGQQSADAVVEALENEEAGKKHDDEDEPYNMKIHRQSLPS